MTPDEAMPAESRDDEPALYTMHDLTERADRIIEEIRQSGRPAFITSYGRFIAVITPLADGEIESRVLTAMAREIGERTPEPAPEAAGPDDIDRMNATGA